MRQNKIRDSTGAGETAITLVPAAIGNAILDAAGIRLREVPFTAGRVLAALRAIEISGEAAGSWPSASEEANEVA